MATEAMNAGSADAPQAESAGPETKNMFVLASKSHLDQKIVKEGRAPTLLETVKDEAGSVLIHKYEKLTKPIWQKYRTKPECRPLHFICDLPQFAVIDGINVTFFLPEDCQFFGALYFDWKNDIVAEQFFNEALKSETADAHINAGVFRYFRGERGVMDNFNLAKKHFQKASALLSAMPLSAAEKNKRRKLCMDVLDEIDYRSAGFFDKLIRLIIRLLTFHFETHVFFIGAAAPSGTVDDKIREMTEGILKYEFELKKKAADRFIEELHQKIGPDMPSLQEELQEIEKEYGVFKTQELLDVAVSRFGEFFADNLMALDRPVSESSSSDAPPPAEHEELPPPNIVCYEMATVEEVDKVAVRYKLASLGDLVDMVSKQKIDPPVIAWLIRDKIDQERVMERLAVSSLVPDHIKKVIEHQLWLRNPGRGTSAA